MDIYYRLWLHVSMDIYYRLWLHEVWTFITDLWLHLPMACGETRWVNPVANMISRSEYSTQHKYCNDNENDSSSYNQIFAENRKRE